MRQIDVYAPDVRWTPMRMIHWNSEPWVKIGEIAYVLTKDYDRKSLLDRHLWPRVRGDAIKDKGFDPELWYPIPFPCFLLYPLGSTIYCPNYPRPRRAIEI